MRSRKRRGDLSRIWFVASCAAVLFAYGVAVGRYQLLPYEILNFGVSSWLQIREEATTLLGIRPDHYLRPAHHAGDGVTVVAEDRMAPGLTLVAGLFEEEQQLRLIRPDGTPVRVWSARMSQLMHGDHPDPDRMPRSDWNTQIHGALALPDGSVMFNPSFHRAVAGRGVLDPESCLIPSPSDSRSSREATSCSPCETCIC